MVTAALSDADARMHRAIEALTRQLATIRTGRASPAIVENIIVDYYGAPTPMKQLASISVPEAQLIVIQPWDREALSSIERGIQKANLGLNPTNDGSVMRLLIPQPTEERRRELVKVVKHRVEEGRVEVRNIRRDILERLRIMERDKELSQDESQRSQRQLQQLTDTIIQQMDSLATEKEAEVMEV